MADGKQMITSFHNDRIKNLAQLNQKARARREQGVFVTEGVKMFLEAPASKIREVYISESFVMQDKVEEKLQGCLWETVSDEVFGRVADTMTPQGILCVVEQPLYNKKELLSQQASLWIILEDIQDPGNLGTIMRAGEGAGITGVIMTKGCVDLFNPKTIRATMGSVYRVPYLVTEDIGAELAGLKKAGVRTYAAHLEGGTDYARLPYEGGSAFLIGNEGKGLRRETAELADEYVKIPMLGQVESLNAAAAASVLMYEAARQRRLRQHADRMPERRTMPEPFPDAGKFE